METNNKHTAGEWLIDGYLIVGEVSKETYDGSGGVIVCDWNPDTEYALPPSQEQQANARLIAAAPEMLEALKRVTEWFYLNGKSLKIILDGKQGTPGCWEEIQAAIHKATEQ